MILPQMLSQITRYKNSQYLDRIFFYRVFAINFEENPKNQFYSFYTMYRVNYFCLCDFTANLY